MTRDELARHLYIHAHDDEGVSASWQDAGAEEWDAGDIKPEDRADCYARADQMIAEGRVTA